MSNATTTTQVAIRSRLLSGFLHGRANIDSGLTIGRSTWARAGAFSALAAADIFRCIRSEREKLVVDGTLEQPVPCKKFASLDDCRSRGWIGHWTEAECQPLRPQSLLENVARDASLFAEKVDGLCGIVVDAGQTFLEYFADLRGDARILVDELLADGDAEIRQITLGDLVIGIASLENHAEVRL